MSEVLTSAARRRGRPPNAMRQSQHIQQHPSENERPPQHEEAHPPAQGRARTRTRTRGNTGVTQQDHDSYIIHENIPPDVSLEWKLYTAVGSEMKNEYPFYLEGMRKQGWEAVDPHTHPDWVRLPPDYPHHNVIVNGLILMERPMALTEEAREEAKFNANQQMRVAKQRLGLTPKDTMTRDFEGVRPKVVEERMRPIPIEE